MYTHRLLGRKLKWTLSNNKKDDNTFTRMCGKGRSPNLCKVVRSCKIFFGCHRSQTCFCYTGLLIFCYFTLLPHFCHHLSLPSMTNYQWLQPSLFWFGKMLCNSLMVLLQVVTSFSPNG